MSFQFVNKPLEHGVYEPEGIYLDSPFDGSNVLVQTWGTDAAFYSQYQYNGITLKGYIGIGFEVMPNTAILAMDRGRVSEVSLESKGFERYVKIDHWWGESIYARVNTTFIESGQLIERGTQLASGGSGQRPFAQRIHIGIRVRPYNRYDGWGGFSDPLPFLNPIVLRSNITTFDILDRDKYPLLPLAKETNEMRRP